MPRRKASVGWLEVHLAETASNVNGGHVDRAKASFGLMDGSEDALQRVSKLNGFLGSNICGFFVDTKVSAVADGAWLPFVLKENSTMLQNSVRKIGMMRSFADR